MTVLPAPVPERSRDIFSPSSNPDPENPEGFLPVCFKIYLKDRVREGREKCIFYLLTGSLSNWPQRPGLGQVETKCLEIHLGIPHRWQGPKHLGHPPLLSQAHEQGADDFFLRSSPQVQNQLSLKSLVT